MIFYYHNDKHNNFGDELNRWIWPQVVPEGILYADTDATVYGIGTVLHSGIQERPHKVLLGAGTGYGNPPRVDDTYTVHCVRGPLTARQLGLGEDKACVDPAILVSDLFSYDGSKKYDYSYMPHYHQAIWNGREWKRICDKANIHYIDPRLQEGRSFEDVLIEIAQTQVLLSEAMHGAIVADALRTPWIAVRTTNSILAFKWKDWAASLNMTYKPYHVRWKGDILKQAPLVRRFIWEAAYLQLYAIRCLASEQLSNQDIHEQRKSELRNHIDDFVNSFQSRFD